MSRIQIKFTNNSNRYILISCLEIANVPLRSLILYFSLGDDVNTADFDGSDKVLVAQHTHAQVSLRLPTGFASSAASAIPRIREHGDVGDVPVRVIAFSA